MPEPALNHATAHHLDHRIGDSRCRSLPGGPLRHARTAWLFRDLDRWVLRPLHAVGCRLGVHRVQYVLDSDTGRRVWCQFCVWERPPTPAEEASDRWPRT